MPVAFSCTKRQQTGSRGRKLCQLLTHQRMIHEIAGGWYPVKIKEDYIIVTDPVSVGENTISEISVYPNPTSSVINISAEGMQNITIIDMTGRVVMSKDVNSNFETISAEGFAKANYMVRIATADGVVVKNIVVE